MIFLRKRVEVVGMYSVLIGALVALIWAALNIHAYEEVVEHVFFTLPSWLGDKEVNIHFLANEVGMAFFFLYAGAEVRQSLLPGGSLETWSKRAAPLAATAGGVIGPAVIFYFAATRIMPEISNGWVVPTATDIVFALLLADIVFGKGHPARGFLLALAVLDDAVGLVLIPSVYSDGVDWLPFLGVLVVVILITIVLHRRHVRHWGWYLLLAGVPSWLAFIHFGVEPALALVPIVAFMPHAKADVGWFAPWYDKRERSAHDTLSVMANTIERFFNPWVLLLFGFANVGIQLGFGDKVTYLVLGSLVFGKVIGITFATNIAMLFGAKLPDGLRRLDVIVLSSVAAVGFTVALFVAGVAFTGEIESSAKLGAFMSLPVAGALAFVASKALGVKRVTEESVSAT